MRVWEIILTFKIPIVLVLCGGSSPLEVPTYIHTDESYVAVASVSYLRLFEIVLICAF